VIPSRGRIYSNFRAFRLDWPCLSFDLFRNKGVLNTTCNIGERDSRREMSQIGGWIRLITGTNSVRANENSLVLIKTRPTRVRCSGHVEAESESLGDTDDNNINDGEDGNIDFSEKKIDEEGHESSEIERMLRWRHEGTVNRVRINPMDPSLVASMSENGKVYVFNIQRALSNLEKANGPEMLSLRPVFEFCGHESEGYALAWSPHHNGTLLTGDIRGNVYLWRVDISGEYWRINEQNPFRHHGSVEDIVWSPVEPYVFATAATDGMVRIWDVRDTTRPKITFKAHDDHVNVISWNRIRQSSHLLASGSEDGLIHVWDLREIGMMAQSQKQKDGVIAPKPIASLIFHRGPITSVDWHPSEEAVLIAASEDHLLSVWDLSLEEDGQNRQELPASLYFLHQGQQQLKEIMFSPDVQGMIVSTAETGFNVFRPVNL